MIDIIMQDISWEMKSSEEKGKNIIKSLWL